MKRNIRFLLTALLVAMMSIGLSSCNKDDDDDGGSGGGNKAAVVDGKAYNMKYAWYRAEGGGRYWPLEIEFSNVDIYDFDYICAQRQIRVQHLGIIINNYVYHDVQSGTYNAEILFEDASTEGYSYETKKWRNVQYHAYDVWDDEVIITRDGDNYSVTIPETMIEPHIAGKETSVPFSFYYTGKISEYSNLDWE